VRVERLIRIAAKYVQRKLYGEKLISQSRMQSEEDDSAWRGSNYMSMAGISHVEMLQEARSLGFVAVTGTVHEANEGPIYSPSMVELLQSMGFNFMNEFSESEPSEIGDAAQAPQDSSEIQEEAPNDVP